MKKTVLITLGVLVLVSFLTRPAAATAITFTVPPDKIGTTLSGGPVDLFSTGLNGTVLSGQSLSLDLVFQPGMLARVSMVNPSTLGVNLTVFTNAAGSPGFAGAATTGYLLDAGGNPFGATQTAGRSATDGSFNVGLVTFTNPSMTADISGAHFDLVMPNTLFTVTNAQLRFNLTGQNNMLFGTVQQLPETSSMVLLGIGLVVIAWRLKRGAAEKQPWSV
jgi:hypothetical protein